jgi:predicted amidophosphoribosyltransferase
MRWTRIDETTRAAHCYLTEQDECLHLREYFARQGYQGGDSNQLIFNLKIKPTVAAANAARRHYKERAIQQCAADLRASVPRDAAEQVTWVPIPPSKVPGHADYDDRLLRVLLTAFAGYDVDIRGLLRQTASTEADHTTENRLGEDTLRGVLELDRDLLAVRPPRRRVVLFDDVLTTGKHFKCCEFRLREALPDGLPILGMFIARSVRLGAQEDFADLRGA